jgi:formate dehydrogenase subunit delta
MDIDTLIRMANQIGTFYEAYPDHDAACREVLSHLNRFWEPRMRSELVAHVRTNGTDGLTPLVSNAVSQLVQAHPVR